MSVTSATLNNNLLNNYKKSFYVVILLFCSMVWFWWSTCQLLVLLEEQMGQNGELQLVCLGCNSYFAKPFRTGQSCPHALMTLGHLPPQLSWTTFDRCWALQIKTPLKAVVLEILWHSRGPSCTQPTLMPACSSCSLHTNFENNMLFFCFNKHTH